MKYQLKPYLGHVIFTVESATFQLIHRSPPGKAKIYMRWNTHTQENIKFKWFNISNLNCLNMILLLLLAKMVKLILNYILKICSKFDGVLLLKTCSISYFWCICTTDSDTTWMPQRDGKIWKQNLYVDLSVWIMKMYN